MRFRSRRTSTVYRALVVGCLIVLVGHGLAGHAHADPLPGPTSEVTSAAMGTTMGAGTCEVIRAGAPAASA